MIRKIVAMFRMTGEGNSSSIIVWHVGESFIASVAVCVDSQGVHIRGFQSSREILSH